MNETDQTRASYDSVRSANRITCVTYLVVSLVFGYSFWNTAPRLLLVIAILLLSGTGLWSLASLERDRRRPETVGSGRVLITKLLIQAIVSAFAWAFMFSVSVVGASNEGQIAIICASLGTIAIGALTFATVPVASIAWTVITLIGTLVTISVANVFPVTLFPLIIMFSLILIQMTNRQSKLFNKHIEAVNDLAAAEAERMRIVYLATHDALTGLANRVEFQALLVDALSREEAATAVFCVDLDRFKEVNDTLGHPAGDELLREVARRLVAVSARHGQVVGRVGGDEFVMFASPASTGGVAALAQDVVDDLGREYCVAGERVSVGASVGVAVSPAHGRDAVELLRAADVALYRAKATGRGRWCLFEAGMDADRELRLSFELALRHAVSTSSFELHYQPIFALASMEVTTIEAFVRWRREDGLLVHPDEFVSFAEDAGLMFAIGEWVLREGCRVAARWPDDVGLAVNVSRGQFVQNGLEAAVMSALLNSGLPPCRLELEIPESLLMQPSKAMLETLHRLKRAGVQVALANFGTGNLSLSFLRNFPFDKIKIDRSFVGDLDGRGVRAIVEAVARLATELGMVTTAEGIESMEQLLEVRAAGCTEGQGYFLHPPGTIELLTARHLLGPRRLKKA